MNRRHLAEDPRGERAFPDSARAFLVRARCCRAPLSEAGGAPGPSRGGLLVHAPWCRGTVPAVVSGLAMTKGVMLGHDALRYHHLFAWPAFALIIGIAAWRSLGGGSANERPPLGYVACGGFGCSPRFRRRLLGRRDADRPLAMDPADVPRRPGTGRQDCRRGVRLPPLPRLGLWSRPGDCTTGNACVAPAADTRGLV
jgi:hypothetical protein